MVRFSDIRGILEMEGGRRTSSFSRRAEEPLPPGDANRPEEQRPSGILLSDGMDPEAQSCYGRFVRTAMDVKERVSGGRGIDPAPILADLKHILEHNLVEKLYAHSMSAPEDSQEVFVHSVEVTFVSLLIGKGMGYDMKGLFELGLSAFLENVGMYTLPCAVLQKETKLDESEIERIKKHPETSYQILSRLGKEYLWLAETAIQVHERADGSGYPKGLKEGEISEKASIIGLVDTYLAMCRKRPHRDRFLKTDAIKFMLKEAKKQFPVRALKALLNEISLFPLNTYVKLNNESIGRVIGTEKNQPLRPIIDILYDNLGKRPQKSEIIRLSDNPLLYVTETVDERELA